MTENGLARAVSDLGAFFDYYGRNYLDDLSNDPPSVASMLENPEL